ncbi:O-antigen ligase family protein [Desulfomicrobium escambiense]|uniref:O-antigen ligase family protein n=1 Tax=Desulfomicrobium escambiense TaxID=29503 RepID=UPI0004043CEB|nr:O-antigen ligase family protein [Desulfomicrobium escambiense]
MNGNFFYNCSYNIFNTSFYSKENINSFSYNLLRIGFCIFILTLPIGKAPSNVGAVIALIGLTGYYSTNYYKSNFYNLERLKWIYILFISFLFFKIFHNINISNGWYGFYTNTVGAFTLFLIGLEFIRNEKDIKLLVVLFAIAGFYEGLDGIYQYVTGFDLIRGDAPLGGPTGIRLTGSFKTYRVGNYMSLVLPVALATWFILPIAWKKFSKFAFMTALLTPGIFLLAGSQTRSGLLGFFVATTASLILLNAISWKGFVGCGTVLGSALLFVKRTSFEMIMRDGRIKELWPYAWKVFESAPLLGVGLNSYNPGVHALGLKFHMHSQSIQHPHNIYLQFLCEMGIVGLAILLFFLLTYMLWALRRIVNNRSRNQGVSWKLTSCFWAAFLGYMASGISAHDFFRTWWLGMAFSILGILLGCSLALKTEAEAEIVYATNDCATA